MENKKHIFATHVNEIGEKNPQLEQNINVINEMANGGNIPEKLEVGKTYKVADFEILRDDVNQYFSNLEEFKVFKTQEMGNELVYYIEKKNYSGKYPFMIAESNLKRKENANKNVAPTNSDYPYLKQGETYNIDNFTIFNNNEFKNNIILDDNKLFRVNEVNEKYKMYVLENLSLKGRKLWRVSFLDIKPLIKSNLKGGEIIDMSKYQILDYEISKNIRKEDIKYCNIYINSSSYDLIIASTGEVINLEKDNFVEIDSFPKFDYQVGDEIEIDKVDTSEGRITQINLMKSLGYKNYKVVGFLPKDSGDGYSYEVVVGNSTPFYYNLIPTDKVEPKGQPLSKPTEMLEDLNLQVATKSSKKSSTEKFNFKTATQNFIQQNIIGENIIFTPKFVLLESLMELNELTKVKERDLSNDLESIINDIDSFVFEQVEIEPTIERNTQIKSIQPTQNRKSKKSKPMPNMDIKSMANNPDFPEELREILLSGLNTGKMNVING